MSGNPDIGQCLVANVVVVAGCREGGGRVGYDDLNVVDSDKNFD